MKHGNVAGYRHRQTGPWFVILYTLGLILLGVGLLTHDEPGVALLLPLTGALVLVFGASFQHLTVVDEGECLAIRFGPLPLFHKRIRYAKMVAVEVGRTSWMDGWGIHLSLHGGWVWNIRGRDCVVIHHGGKTWLGTDDADNLARFLKTKLSPHDRDGRVFRGDGT